MDESRHLRLSLACVAVFLASGLWLEGMIGLRAAGWLEDPLRREMLRLGHAHGAILGVVNLALGWTIHRLNTPAAWAPRIRLAAWMGAVCVGVGFFGGGLWHGTTDPGPLVLIVPAGALMLLGSCVTVALLR